MRWVWAMAFGLLSLTGCGSRVSGVYQDAQGTTAYEFRAGGRAYITVLQVTVLADYTVDGDKVIVSSPQGTVVLTQTGNHLLGPMGLELHRQGQES